MVSEMSIVSVVIVVIVVSVMSVVIVVSGVVNIVSVVSAVIRGLGSRFARPAMPVQDSEQRRAVGQYDVRALVVVLMECPLPRDHRERTARRREDLRAQGRG